MNLSEFQVRRATLEDLRALRELWKDSALPVHDLEKRLTEFQVVADHEGQLQGAIGLHHLVHQGLIHSESFFQPEVADEVRPSLWNRLQRQAHNHGLIRFWTRETSPFWRHYAGFREATAAELEKMPVDFGEPTLPWLIFPLREEVNPAINAEREIEIFRQAQKGEMERWQNTAQLFKKTLMLFAAILFVALLVGCVYLLVRTPVLPAR
jgi:N-acetylglutamate synthase-like GNAT family acetyltransferase